MRLLASVLFLFLVATSGHARDDSDLATKIFKFGRQPVSLGVQGGYFAVSPPGGPEWRVRESRPSCSQQASLGTRRALDS
jgi:hypothetical protein